MKIQVVENVLKANDAIANDNRAKMAPHNILCVNIMSAPGSGKTTMLQKTIPALKDQLKCAVLVGDLQTTRDAERLDNLGAQVVQINTGRGCHLDPTQVTQGAGISGFIPGGHPFHRKCRQHGLPCII